MKKTAILLIIFLVSVITANAQTLSVSGKITDKQNMPLIGADAILLKASDSSFIKGNSTDKNGDFVISGVFPGNYIIKVSYVGFGTLYVNKTLTTQSVSLGTLVLNDKASLLGGVNVTEKLLPTQLKGDTTQYNAGAFKTNPDATAEDLVTKMPGITSQNNKVQAQNENVKQVLVNGKPFFGDDPNAVLKNLPAEIIDKIQVYDEKSDQSQFTGFDDGNTSKTINIITKTQFHNGTFGKIYGGYGYGDNNVWKGGFNLNFFKNNRRLTILAQSNNINDQNFSSEDLLGVIGSNGGNRGPRGSSGGSSSPYSQANNSNNFLVDQKGGVTTTNSVGINYVNKWKKLDFTGSYFLNYTDNNITSDLFRQYFTQSDMNLTYTEQSKSSSTNVNHRANIKIDWKIDSLNSLLFRPRLSVQQNKGNSSLSGVNMQSGITTGSTENDYNSKLIGINFSAPLLYRHSFRKERRTFSVNITPGYTQSTGKSYLYSTSLYIRDTIQTADTINQLAKLDKQGFSLSSSLVYTEPISKKSQLMFTYGANYNKSPSDMETYNYSVDRSEYSVFDTILSNKFNTTYFSQSLGASYRFQSTKWSFNIGISGQDAQLQNDQQFPYSYSLGKTFYSLLPNAMFQFKFSTKRNLRIFYRSSNDAPSVSQLQDVINNTNSLLLTSGNPNLTQDWQNSLNIRYSSVNTAKSTAFFVLFGGTFTQNYIATESFIARHDSVITPGIILYSGSQLSKPVNLNGYYNIRAFVNYSFAIPKIKCNFSSNLGGTYGSTPGLINNSLNHADNATASLGLVLSSNISEKVDFTISSNSSYYITNNSMQSKLNTSYFNQNSKLKIQVMPWKGLVLQTDLTHQYYDGLSQNYNQNYLLWNAAIGYKFLKNKAAEFRLSVYDILKQNTSLTRNTTDTYYEDVQTNVLQRYLMLTFTYNLKNFKGGGNYNSDGPKNHPDGRQFDK